MDISSFLDRSEVMQESRVVILDHPGFSKKKEIDGRWGIC